MKTIMKTKSSHCRLLPVRLTLLTPTRLRALLVGTVLLLAAFGAQPVAAQAPFSENFNSNTLGTNLVQLEGNPVVLSAGNLPIQNSGWGQPLGLVATVAAGYHTIDFVAQVTVVAHNPSACSDQVYFGLGKGGTGGTGGYPLDGPVVLLRHITRWAGDCSSDINNLTIAINDIVGYPGNSQEILNQGNVGPGFGPYTLQLRHLGGLVTFHVNGVQFGPAVDVSSYDFSGGRGRVFLAGQNVTFDDFVVTPPAPGGLDLGFNPGANNTVYSTAVQADGKIVIGGYTTSST